MALSIHAGVHSVRIRKNNPLRVDASEAMDTGAGDGTALVGRSLAGDLLAGVAFLTATAGSGAFFTAAIFTAAFFTGAIFTGAFLAGAFTDVLQDESEGSRPSIPSPVPLGRSVACTGSDRFPTTGEDEDEFDDGLTVG